MLRLLFFVCSITVGMATTLVVRTPGLSIEFNKTTAAPVSVKNAKGEELLDEGSAQLGFYLRHPNNRTPVPFDEVTEVGENELIFGVAATGEKIGWAFGGQNHYLTANCTLTHGFDRGADGRGDGKEVYFQLTGSAPDTLRGIGLNYIVYDSTGEGAAPPAGVRLQYEAPWENSTWNPPARFGVYERVDDATEDETLFDFWVDEGLPRPRASGEP